MTRARGLFSLAWIVALFGFLAPACSTSIRERAAIDPAKEAGPRPVNHESPHIEIKVDRTVIRPGQTVHVKAYGRGDLKGGWRCTSESWRGDGGWQTEGTEAGAQCGDVGETWIWPTGPGRPYTFVSPGEHQVCVEIHDRWGWIVGKQECVRVDVVRGE